MFVPRTDLLSSISAKIAEKLGPQKYKVWFKNATQFVLVENHLKISAPNAFLCGWIERNFAEVISAAAREVAGQEFQLSFVVDPRLLVTLKKRQLNSQADFIAKNPERVARECRREGTVPAVRKLRGRFGELVIGPANELAVSVLRRLAGPGVEAYSPVFVHGGCGLGKTHLVQALANELAEKHPNCRWQYTTGDEFTNEFVLGIRSNRVEAFRQRYRHLDVLIIDDIHFLANKKATQEEFLHTFNAIDGHRRKIVLTSDTHPKLIGQFSDQLINRFMAGMVVRLEVPDFAMRCEILRRRAARMSGQSLPEDVIAYIAGHMTANVRELEGALLKLMMFSTVAHQPVTLGLARRALADHIERSKRSLGLEEIDQTVATYFGLTPADLHTSRKTRTIALARGIAMYLARKHTEMSFPEIGRFMGNKNHSTVILASRKIAGMLEADEVVQRQTPAGMAEERLQIIVSKVEDQLGLSGQTRRSATSTVAASAVDPRRTPPPAASPAPSSSVSGTIPSRLALG